MHTETNEIIFIDTIDEIFDIDFFVAEAEWAKHVEMSPLVTPPSTPSSVSHGCGVQSFRTKYGSNHIGAGSRFDKQCCITSNGSLAGWVMEAMSRARDKQIKDRIDQGIETVHAVNWHPQVIFIPESNYKVRGGSMKVTERSFLCTPEEAMKLPDFVVDGN